MFKKLRAGILRSYYKRGLVRKSSQWKNVQALLLSTSNTPFRLSTLCSRTSLCYGILKGKVQAHNIECKFKVSFYFPLSRDHENFFGVRRTEGCSMIRYFLKKLCIMS